MAKRSVRSAVEWSKGLPIVPAAQFTSCPIQTSLGVLGKKWTMLVLRDIAMRKMERYSDLMKSIQGITPRILSTRLQELQAAGLIFRIKDQRAPRFVRWNLTEKGWDALPILMSYVAFGAKWFAPSVFADGKPREMKEVYPQDSLKELYVNIEVDEKKMKRLLKDDSAQKTLSWTQSRST